VSGRLARNRTPPTPKGSRRQQRQRRVAASVSTRKGSLDDDNAPVETTNGLYKTELVHRRAPWKRRDAVELVTLEWVSWFNHHRLPEPVGYIPPAEAEANY
jgi:transposase InsO family protein